MSANFNINQSQEKLLEESHNEIFVFSCDDLKFHYAHKGAIENVGYTLDELREMKPTDIKPHYDIHQFAALVEPLIKKQV